MNKNDFTAQHIIRLKAKFERETGKKARFLKIGTKAMNVLIDNMNWLPGGILNEIEGLTPVISGTEWTFEVSISE